MEQIDNTPISEKEWINADPKTQVILDAIGRHWKICAHVRDSELGHVIRLQLQGGLEEEVCMTNCFGGRHLVNVEEWAIIVELNSAGVTIVNIDDA